MQLIIAGFHRSGTSLLAQVLHAAGLFVGDDLLGASFGNPHGHFEDREVLALHTRILARHGLDWEVDQPFALHLGDDDWAAMADFVRRRDAEHERWGFKEPRGCLLMGAWKHLMPAAKTVVVYRDPGDSVRSLESRQATEHLNARDRGREADPAALRFYREPDHGLRLWDTYNRALVAYVRAHEEDCLVLPFTRLTDGSDPVSAVNRRLGLDLDPPVRDVFDPRVTRRRESPQWVHDPAVAERVGQTLAALEELAARTAA